MEKSFNFKESYFNVMKMLEPSAQAELIMGINSYYFDGVEPSFNDIVLKASWALIKPQLETSEKKVGRPRKDTAESIHIEVGKVEDKKEEPIVIGEKIDDFDLMLSTPDVKPQDNKPMDNGFNFFGSSYAAPVEKTKKTKKEKEPKHRYGTYNNVELTDAEMERLNNEYGKDKTNKAIEYLSGYKQEKGYKTKDDNLTMRRWVFDAVDRNNNNPWNNNNVKKEPDYGEEDEELRQIRERNKREAEEREKERERKRQEEQNKTNGEIF